MPPLSLLVNTVNLNQINAKIFLPIIPIGIVAYALMLLWDNLCRNSCIHCVCQSLIERPLSGGNFGSWDKL